MKGAAAAIELGESKIGSTPRSGVNRGAAILDFILRIIAFLGTLVSAIAMGTTRERLPFFTQFLQFRAEYDDLPTFTYVFLTIKFNLCFHIEILRYIVLILLLQVLCGCEFHRMCLSGVFPSPFYLPHPKKQCKEQ